MRYNIHIQINIFMNLFTTTFLIQFQNKTDIFFILKPI
jgi:hypothetical protein